MSKLSLDEYLEDYFYNGRSGETIYEAFSDFESDKTRSNLKIIAEEYDFSIKSLEMWLYYKQTPYIVKQVKALEKRGFLPLEEGDNHDLIQELFLFGLFSGRLQKNKNSFCLTLFEKTKVLEHVKNELKKIEGLTGDVYKDVRNNSYSLILNSEQKQDPIAVSICRIVYLFGMPLGKKLAAEIKIPSTNIIDPKLMLYYLHKLRGHHHENGFYFTLPTRENKKSAEKLKNKFIQYFNNNLNFFFKGHEQKRDDGHYSPILALYNNQSYNQLTAFKKFIKRYEKKARLLIE